MHSCRPCDYDLCEECFSKQTLGEGKETEATAPDEDKEEDHVAEAELAEGEEEDDGIDHALEYLLRGTYMSRL